MEQSDSKKSTFPLIFDIERVFCIEFSKDGNILYCGGELYSENARKNCPIIALNAETGEIKCKIIFKHFLRIN